MPPIKQVAGRIQMDHKRRKLFQAIIPGLLVSWLLSGRSAAGQDPQGQEPNAPPGRPTPFPDETLPGLPKIDNKRILKHNQTQIQQDVDKLYDLAGELKAQVDATDSAEVLSVRLLNKAEEVEKLAHQIRGLAKG
jgi:hypothetical protein